MKKYSSSYFEKKYQILFGKLAQKEGFVTEITKLRVKHGLPESGFQNTIDLVEFLIKKLNKKNKQSLTLWAFVSHFEAIHKERLNEGNKEKALDEFILKYSKQDLISPIPMYASLGESIESHHNFFTKHPIFEESKYHKELYPVVSKLMSKYWGVDLLDEHTIFHFIEKYFFIGKHGVDLYIKSRISCHNCMYLGINHFSPNRNNMNGKEEGPYSKNYIFNRDTVISLSQHFNSVFLFIKPYATKELTLQYINDNWDDIQTDLDRKNIFYKQYDVNPAIIKESNDERNRLVYELYKLSKKDLLKVYKGGDDLSGKGIYKEMIVSAILEDEHGISMTSDGVKKTAVRYAKSIKIQQQPKDIRDI